jgi:endonuclease/exonuclease/phosphatase family metal-dependent hydrolase
MRSRSRVARVVSAAAVLGLLVAAPLAAEAAPVKLKATLTQAPTKTDIPMGKVTATLKPQTAVNFATFNVRTSRADRGTPHHWLRRVGSVAREIKSRNPGIVAIQELGPGRADGRKASLHGATRQTESLERALQNIGAGKYQLVRTTAYVRPGANHGTQGARILYDTSRFGLVSRCPEYTGSKGYNPSCSMDMPVRGGDGQGARRSAAYAQFQSKATGQRFWVASVHLDDRHSGGSAERSLDALRGAQISAVYNKVQSLNTAHVPVIIAGDVNSWRSKSGGDAPYNYLIGQGLQDASVTAETRIDAQYPTVNHFQPALRANATGRQVALDIIMTKGDVTFTRYENVMEPYDSSRPSDHNMVVSDMSIPKS